MHARVAGGDDAAAFPDGRAAPIGEYAPRILDNRNERRHVPRRKRCLDNQIDVPERVRAADLTEPEALDE